MIRFATTYAKGFRQHNECMRYNSVRFILFYQCHRVLSTLRKIETEQKKASCPASDRIFTTRNHARTVTIIDV